MFARLTAAYCLLHLVVATGWALPTDQSDNGVVVYLKADVAPPQRTLNYMKLELGSLMSAAGYRTEWQDAGGSPPSTEWPLVVVQLRGTCRMPQGNATAGHAGKALATTSTSGGQIIPFSFVDCKSVNHLLAGALASESGERREFLYGRALARLLAHELCHVLLRSGDHARGGIAKAEFSARDLLIDQIGFEESTLARLRPPQTTRVSSDGAVGR
jgi:hypothetical protein